MRKPWSSKRLTILGLLSLILPVFTTSLWIYIFNSMPKAEHEKRVNAFFNYFPDFLQNSIALTLITLIFSIAATILGAIGFERSTILSQKIINVFTIVAGILIAILQLSSLL
jgi:ABC-type Fe3+ transport system permease subunit